MGKESNDCLFANNTIHDDNDIIYSIDGDHNYRIRKFWKHVLREFYPSTLDAMSGFRRFLSENV